MKNRSIWAILLILTPLVLSISLSMDIYVPSLPFITRGFHTTQSIVQWTLSIYMLGTGIGQLCLGPLSDKFGRRKVVLCGLILYLIGTLVCIDAHWIGQLIIGRLLQSLGTCSALVVAYAVVRDLYDTTQSAKIYSLLNAATALGPVIAPLIGGALQVSYHTWRASFIFLFIFTMISLITTYFFLKETLDKNKRINIQPRETLRRFRNLIMTPAFTKNAYHASTGMTVLFVFCCISSYLLITQLQVSELQYGLSFSSNAITFIIANLISAQLSHRYTLATPLKFGSLFMLVGSLIMIAINLSAGLSIFHFLAPMWIITFGAGLLMGPAVALALERFPNQAGTASSLISASQFVFAGVIGTLLMQNKVTSLIPFALTVAIMSLIGILWHSTKKRRNERLQKAH